MSGKRIAIAALAVLVTAGIAFSIVRAVHRKRSTKPPETISAIQAREGIPVVTSIPVRCDIADVLQFDGSVRPQAEARVVPKIEARIERITREEGEEVKAGELLVLLQEATFKQVLTAAESALAEARANFERVESLRKEGGVSQKDFEQARAYLDAALAQEQSARQELEETKIHAPANGIVSERLHEPGELALPGVPILEIVDIGRVEIACQVSEKSIAAIRVGMEANVHLDALPGRKFSAAIARINPVADPTSRLFTVTVMLDNPEGVLRPGMYARLEVAREIHRQVLAVPEHALLKQSDETFVFLKLKGVAVKRSVKVGLVSSGMAEIMEGLSPEDRVVTTGQRQVTEGARLVEKEPA